MTLDDDVSRAVDELRRTEGLGTSAAVNALARRGLAHGDAPRRPFSQRVSSLGRPRIPLDDVGGVIEMLDDETHRR